MLLAMRNVPFNASDQIEIIEKLLHLSVCKVGETKISIKHVMEFADSVLTFSFICTTFYCLETAFNYPEIDVIRSPIKLKHGSFNEKRLQFLIEVGSLIASMLLKL